MKRGIFAHLMKRFWHITEIIGDEGSKIDNKILERMNAPKLDPIEKRDLKYPEILFPIKNAASEWWYFTGHLKSGQKRYGFEFCIFKFHPEMFRLGAIPLYALRKEPYLVVHTSITDVENGKFEVFQDSGLFDKESIDYDKLELEVGNSKLNFNEKFKIKSGLFDLELRPMKRIVKHFDEGYNIMYQKPQNRTYYLSFTRMKAKGKIVIEGKEQKVSGTAWFDHQKSNLVHRNPIRGWDWFSIQLQGNKEVMLYMIRDKKGINNKFGGGSYIDEKSNVVQIKRNEIKTKVLDYWKSDKTGTRYPSGWEIEINKLKTKLIVEPLIKDQEIGYKVESPTSYWEGACKVSGKFKGKKTSGDSYVELVGYDKRPIINFMREMQD